MWTGQCKWGCALRSGRGLPSTVAHRWTSEDIAACVTLHGPVLNVTFLFGLLHSRGHQHRNGRCYLKACFGRADEALFPPADMGRLADVTRPAAVRGRCCCDWACACEVFRTGPLRYVTRFSMSSCMRSACQVGHTSDGSQSAEGQTVWSGFQDRDVQMQEFAADNTYLDNCKRYATSRIHRMGDQKDRSAG